MKQIAVYGAGGVGVDSLSLIENINQQSNIWEILGVFDDFIPKKSMVLGYPVLGDFNQLNKWDLELSIVVAISDPSTKMNLVSRVTNSRQSFPSLIHPSVVIAQPATLGLGEGSIVFAGSVIMPRVTLGSHTLIYLNSTIGHDTKIGNYCSIMPGANISGNVDIGEKVFVGTGAQIIQNIRIGPNATIGAGAVVVDNIDAGQTVVGVPARPLSDSNRD